MINISELSNWTGFRDVLTIRCPQGVGTFLGIYDNDPTFPLVVEISIQIYFLSSIC